ncbi:hypothetical protein [Paraburkholderia adhaesiva]|uniref:hypothetical protein n=1 Tax=Paraburkholderia adhaesiva TaxID=2883244 RepID=UPI001F429120|nr:hypothetical protein [Paraburkholderia adhaesiva]
MTDEYGRVVVKSHQPDTKAYTVKPCNGGQLNLMLKDAPNSDPNHIDQRTHRGVRAT